MRDKSKDLYITIALFVGVLIFHEILNLNIHNPWAMGDEIGVLSTSAFFSGYDWRTVLQAPSDYGAGVNYYGGGFGILFTPLFTILKKRPYLLYQLILLICSTIQSIPCILAYKLLYNHFKINNRIYCILFSIASSFFVASRATNAMNENMIILCMWIVAYIIVILATDKCSTGKKGGLSAVVSFILAYSYTVHSRALIIYGVFVCCIFFALIVYKKKLVLFKVFIPSSMLFYYIASLFNNYILNNVFLPINKVEGVVQNTGTSAIVSVIGQFSDVFRNLRAYLDLFISNLFSMGMVTGGLLIISFLIFICFFFRGIILRIKGISEDSDVQRSTVLGLFVFGCTIGMLLLFSMHWLSTSIDSLSNNEATRGYFYLRYMGAFWGPGMVIMALDIWRSKDSQNKCFIFTWIATVALLFLSFAYIQFSILKRLNGKYDPQLDYFHFFSPFNGQKYGDYTNDLLLYRAVIIITIIIILIGVMIYFKKIIMTAVLVTVFIVYQYTYLALNFDAPYAMYMHSSTSSITDIVLNNNIYIDNLYFPLVTGKWEVPYLVQYYLPEVDIIKEFPDASEENVVMVVFKELDSDEYDLKEFYFALLQDGSYVYVKGNEIRQKLEGIGLTFLKSRE